MVDEDEQQTREQEWTSVVVYMETGNPGQLRNNQCMIDS